MYKKSSKKAIQNGEPVFIDDGNRRVCAGYINNGVFIKPVKEKHILRKPEAIALQANLLELLVSKGVHSVIARLVDRDKRLRASVDDFLKLGFKLNRGFGLQVALPLSKWTDLDALKMQGSLFGGDF